jgi:hypothetical protein
MPKISLIFALTLLSTTAHASTEYNQECSFSGVPYSSTQHLFTVSGKVSNSAKAAISNAQINFYKPSGEFEGYAETDEGGFYSLDIQAGAYLVETVNKNANTTIFLNAPRDAATRQIIKANAKLNITLDDIKPVITSTQPATIATKAGYIITGSGFGTTRGYVDLNGYLTNSTTYIKSWTDTQISLVKASTMPTTGCLKIYAKYAGYSDCFEF